MRTTRDQYNLVIEAREVLFIFCESISWQDYVSPVPGFGQGTIRKAQAHIADTYIHWIGKYALQKNIPYLELESLSSMIKVRDAFTHVDQLVDSFFSFFDDNENIQIKNHLTNRGEVIATPLSLITHVITHEFHHKGQIVSMARMLGYPPPDTDLIRF